MKYIKILHPGGDGKTKVKAKVIKETPTEIEVEFKDKGLVWGLTLPKNHISIIK